MKPRKIISAATDITLLALFVYLLVFPDFASEATVKALSFCGKILVPALFVYSVLSKIIITHPLTDRLIRLFGAESVSLLCGLLCGSPIGAKNALTLYESGRIGKKQAEYLVSFTGNASLSFVLGYLGVGLFGDIRVGIRLFLFQLCGAVAAAVIMKYIIFGKEKLPKCAPGLGKRVGLREALWDSAQTMLSVCSTAAFFIIASGAAVRILPLSPFCRGLFSSALEFSSGCGLAPECGSLATVICAFAIGFGGISVAMQVKGAIKNRLAFRPYLAGKAISCAVTVALECFFG